MLCTTIRRSHCKTLDWNASAAKSQNRVLAVEELRWLRMEEEMRLSMVRRMRAKIRPSSCDGKVELIKDE